MKRTVLVLAASAIASASILAGSAAAAAHAPKGKEIVEIRCEGVGAIMVSVPRPEQSWGVGQVVGQKLHGIPTVISVSVVDVESGETIYTETKEKGNGHANHNQQTTNCSSTFEALASEFFEEEGLPPGVEGGDTIRGTLAIKVVVKG
jgi:hypothetical protein